MSYLLLLPVILSLGADTGAPAAALEFKDTDSFDGRSVLQYQMIEFRDTPLRPMPEGFKPGEGSRYGLLRVGPKFDTALSIVWRPKDAGSAELWLDANGDGRFADNEHHVMTGRELAVPATITVQLGPKPKQVQRTLLLRRSTVGEGLRYSVRGYAQGSLAIGKTTRGVLLVDGNADGLFDTVGQDRVWLDLDGDGRFDPLTERFPLGKPISYAGETYVVRSDPLASAVQANPRSAAQGKLRLALVSKPGSAPKASIELISDLGELIATDKLNQPVSVPIGEYCLSWIKLEIPDTSGQTWVYSFQRDKPRNYTVKTGQETTIPVVEKLAMNVLTREGPTSDGKCKPGETLVITARLVADESLYLSSCRIGKGSSAPQAEGSAEILLTSKDGKTISRGVTGFG